MMKSQYDTIIKKLVKLVKCEVMLTNQSNVENEIYNHKLCVATEYMDVILV